MNELRSAWTNLNTRERWVIVAGAAAVLFILVYALVWAPWQDALARLRLQVPVKQATLTWMQEQAVNIKSLRGQQKSASDDKDPLFTVVEQTAASAKLRDVIRRMSPGEEQEQVRIWLTDVDFDAWLQWLEQLRKRGIEVASATVNRAADNKVNIRVTLQRSS